MRIDHQYRIGVEWTGNRGEGTTSYKAYGRENLVTAEGKPPLEGSADRAFRGDADRWNPEELLVAALSQCHMLSYLHVAVLHGVVVTGYTDVATGVMTQTPDGGGRFREVTLHPVVELADPAQAALADSLHAEANRKCFIAASVNFTVHHEPTTTAAALAQRGGGATQ
ncbi:OsmC family protein [Naasia sp. SYSU D00948]|uniref:OsmC family protein n=1 Tax=Naasia sp. SYSU D00948 TaxID=2817379 RepID=UPI001B317E9D|nr:OsmC family protein [Naasia sp. SYSU D00948]